MSLLTTRLVVVERPEPERELETVLWMELGTGIRLRFESGSDIQGSAKRSADFVKRQPGRARQNS